jgi:hypothetical protein
LIKEDEVVETFHFEEPGNGYQYEAKEVMKCLDDELFQSSLFSWEHSERLIKILDRVREITGIRYPDALEKI